MSHPKPIQMFKPVFHSCNRSSAAPEELVLRMESGDEGVVGERWEAALYVAAGRDPFELVDSAVTAAAALSGSAKPRAEKQMPATLDVFGWCTWDAFYSRVSAQGALPNICFTCVNAHKTIDAPDPLLLLFVDSGRLLQPGVF